MPGRSDGSAKTTPKVLVLGGGFAGVGATRKLNEADAEVVLVDRHDYHTFQPLLYQLATGLLETSAVGHSLRDLVHGQDNATDPPGRGDRDRPRRAHGRVRRARADRLRLPRARPRRGGQLLRDRRRGRARVPDVHAARRRAAQGARARALGGGGQELRASSTTGRSTSSWSAAAQPASRPRARWPSSTAPPSAQDYPRICRRRRRASSSSRPAPRSSRCSRRTFAPTRSTRSRSARSR